MLNCERLYNLLLEKGIEFYSGVPDSLLKHFCAFISDNTKEEKHTITANEGNAIALAAGYHIATGKIGLVYMQNSGQGNALNPLMSLADKEVYGIPMLLLIGWRGEPGVKDEPQHVKQGKITTSLLETLDIPYEILPQAQDEAKKVITKIINVAQEQSKPCALVVQKGTFESYKLKTIVQNRYVLSREEAIKTVISKVEPLDVVVSTTGKISRELFEYREEINEDHSRDFLTVGSMGHSSHIALGIALSQPERNVYCLDGDGSVIMHMGSMAIIGSKKPKRFKHIVLNNGAHDSVGGQPTVGFQIDIPKIAEACFYNTIIHVEKREELKEKLELFKQSVGPSLIEIMVNKGARKDLGRPTVSPTENKSALMKFLANS